MNFNISVNLFKETIILQFYGKMYPKKNHKKAITKRFEFFLSNDLEVAKECKWQDFVKVNISHCIGKLPIAIQSINGFINC